MGGRRSICLAAEDLSRFFSGVFSFGTLYLGVVSFGTLYLFLFVCQPTREMVC